MIDITGERYGKLVAIKWEATERSHSFWSFRCDCGAIVFRSLTGVRGGRVKSCGCIYREAEGCPTRSTYNSWAGAKQRCSNQNDTRYGGRGISMCARWWNSFENFLADMGECPPGMSIDRYPDNNGDYEPGNCRWTTEDKQSRNRRSNVLVLHDDKQMVLKDFAAAIGVKYKALHYRVRYRGESAHEAAEHLLRR